MKLFLLLFSFSTWGEFSELSQKELYQHGKRRPLKSKLKTKSRLKQKFRPRKNKDVALKKLIEQDQKILGLLEASSKQLVIKRKEEKGR